MNSALRMAEGAGCRLRALARRHTTCNCLHFSRAGTRHAGGGGNAAQNTSLRHGCQRDAASLKWLRYEQNSVRNSRGKIYFWLAIQCKASSSRHLLVCLAPLLSTSSSANAKDSGEQTSSLETTCAPSSPKTTMNIPYNVIEQTEFKTTCS